MQVISRRPRQSAATFLILPSLIVLGFLFLAELVDWLDNHAGARIAWSPFRLWLSQYVGDTQAAIGVLTAIAGSLFTVTSVTFSILLLAVQQGATVLNSQIVDHYLRRRANRAWFGFFVGVSVFVLITLVQTTHTASPVFGVTVSTTLGAIALVALIVLIYATVNQTRPATVVSSIVDAALLSRQRQMLFLKRTAAAAEIAESANVIATSSGYLCEIDAPALEAAMLHVPHVRLHVAKPLGSYVVEGETLARVEGVLDHHLEREIASSFHLGNQRDLGQDSSLNVDHLATIGWTAISTAHSDPAVGAITIVALARLLLMWKDAVPRSDTARIHYHDAIHEQLVDALESLMVAATESRQHQSLGLLLDLTSSALPRLPVPVQTRIVAFHKALIVGLREHLPTRQLTASLARFVVAIRAAGAETEAEELRRGCQRFQDISEEAGEDYAKPSVL